MEGSSFICSIIVGLNVSQDQVFLISLTNTLIQQKNLIQKQCFLSPFIHIC